MTMTRELRIYLDPDVAKMLNEFAEIIAESPSAIASYFVTTSILAVRDEANHQAAQEAKAAIEAGHTVPQEELRDP